MGLFGPSKDEKETARLRVEITQLRAISQFQSSDDTRQFIIGLLVEVCDESDLCISAVVAEPLGNILLNLLQAKPWPYAAKRRDIDPHFQES